MLNHTLTEENGNWSSNFLLFGDYDKSCAVERSNVRRFLQEYAKYKDSFFDHITGVYGHERIEFKVPFDSLPEEIQETLESLESYPAIDDQDVCFMESELIESSFFDCLIYFEKDEKEKQDLLSKMYSFYSNNGDFPFIESGGIVYFPHEEELMEYLKSEE